MSARKNAPEQISSLLDNFLEGSGFSDFAMERELKKNWSTLVGERISEIAEIIDFAPPILKIRVEIPSWKMELSYGKDQIIEKINHFLNSEIVKELIIV